MAEEIGKIMLDGKIIYINITPAIGNPYRLELTDDIKKMIKKELVPQLDNIESDIVRGRIKTIVDKL